MEGDNKLSLVKNLYSASANMQPSEMSQPELETTQANTQRQFAKVIITNYRRYGKDAEILLCGLKSFLSDRRMMG